MNLWLWAAAGVLLALAPCGVAVFRGALGDRLVALEMGGALVTIELLLLVEGFGRPTFFDIPLTLGMLSFGSGMVFARFVQRWL